MAAAALAALALGPIALALAALLAALWRRGWRAVLVCATPLSVLALALLHGRLHGEIASLTETLRLHGRFDGRRAARLLHALLPLWLSAAPSAPLPALLFLALRPAAAEPDDLEARSRLDRAERGVVRRAARGESPDAVTRPASAFLGYHLGGDRLLHGKRGRVYLPHARLGHHLLVVGATGSGKTETVLRLAESVMGSSDWMVVFMDGKGDRTTGERFSELARSAGRGIWRFPEASYDGWRGDGGEIAGRLLQLVDFADSGGGTYYRDLAVNAIRLACVTAAGPPRSSTELLRRLTRGALAELHPAGSLAAAEVASLAREIDGIRARYAAFFATVGDALDGAVALEELDCAYVLLDGLRLKHEAGYLARFLVEEFTQWCVGRKPRDRRVLLVVDEFSAIATAGKGLVDVVERTRAFGVSAVLCPQLAEGMGSPEAAARIIGSAQTILLHAMTGPERFVEAAGSRRVAYTTHQLENERLTGRGSTRAGRELRVDPDEVRRLQPGQCFAIGSGLAQKIQVARSTPPLPGLSALRPIPAAPSPADPRRS